MAKCRPRDNGQLPGCVFACVEKPAQGKVISFGGLGCAENGVSLLWPLPFFACAAPAEGTELLLVTAGFSCLPGTSHLCLEMAVFS